MLFSEIYGTYYHTVAKILSKALSGTLDSRALREIVQDTAFDESLLTIPDSLRTHKWPLLTPDLSTPLLQEPTMPLTLLEKRWMKALLLDPRMALFDPDTTGQDFRHSRSLTMELTDERDTLARVLLHFSHLEKETKRLDDAHYRVTLHYDENDETEMLIRILSFGPVVQVTEPESFRQKLRERLTMQERF